MTELLDVLTFAAPGGATPWPLIFLSVLLAFAGGWLMSWTYMLTHSGLSYSRSFVSSLLVIPVIVSLVMMVMADNIITAFGLMAVFAIVRFRNILRDTLDTAHILSVIVIGMAAGTQKYHLAVLAAVVAALIMCFTWWTSFGARHRYDLIVNFQWSKSLQALAPVQTLMHRYGRHVACARQHRHGQSTQLSFRLLLRDPARKEELLHEMEAQDGITRLVGMRAEDEEEV